MSAEFKKMPDGRNVGYYIDGAIQWASGNDYQKYVLHFDNVHRALYPPNKVNYVFNNILIVGGGDMQLKSAAAFLARECRTTLVDPFVHGYQELLVNNKAIIPRALYSSQRRTYLQTSFLEMRDETIQEYLDSLPEEHKGFDMIVCDLTDELALDANNEISGRLYGLLRSGGVMIGYGGLSYSDFMQNSILPLMDNVNFVIESRRYATWNDDGIVYGLIKR